MISKTIWRKQIIGILLIVFLVFGMELSTAITTGMQMNQEHESYPSLSYEDFENKYKVDEILGGYSDSELLDSNTDLKRNYYYSADDYSRSSTDYFGIDDASEVVSDSELQNKQVLQIVKNTDVYLEKADDQKSQTVDSQTNEVIIHGLLSDVIHVINGTSEGEVFLNSELDDYRLDTQDVVDSIVRPEIKQTRNGHFGVLVFVSDFNSRSIEKLQENKIWLQTYSRLETWLTETSDYYVMLVNEYATTDNIMGILAEAQRNPDVKTIGLTLLSHGVNSIYGHGILLHHNDNPEKHGIMDGRFFKQSLEKTGVTRISKLVHTNLHSCYLIDEYETYGIKSVMGFFESQNPTQVLTGYRGLTYLNTRFILSLENLLSAGKYIVPTVTTTTPVVITVDENTKSIGRANYVKIEQYTVRTVEGDLPIQYEENFDSDDTLFVSDINRSPATDESFYLDPEVYEHLGVTPPSFFPHDGIGYSFEGHRQGTWRTINVNDDHWFYFSKGNYDGYYEEFGDGLNTQSSLSALKWNSVGTVDVDDGFVKVTGGSGTTSSITEIGVSTRLPTSSFNVIFKVSSDNIESEVNIGLVGTSSGGMTPAGYAATRLFGIRINISIDGTTDILLQHHQGSSDVYLLANTQIVPGRMYTLSMYFKAGFGFLSLTTREDPDFIVEGSAGGYADLVNPGLKISAMNSEAVLDKYEVRPEITASSFKPNYDCIYEDATVADIKISGSGGTVDETTDLVSGSQSIKAGSTVIPDWLIVENVYTDEINRFLGFAAKVSSSTTELKIQFKVSGITYTIEPKIAYDHRDLVILKDNQWNYYVVDIYSMFTTIGEITSISIQQSGGTVYLDSIYLSSSSVGLASLSHNSIDTIDDPILLDQSVTNPDLYYKYNDNLQDSSVNGYDGTLYSGTAVAFSDNFNDGVTDTIWNYTQDSDMAFTETGGYLTGSYGGGGSGYQYATYSKSVDFDNIEQIMVDYFYYFYSGKMGSVRMYGKNSATGSLTFFIGLHDAWSGSTKRYYTYGYDSSGTTLSNSGYQDVYGYDTGSGSFKIEVNGMNSITMTLTHTAASRTATFNGIGNTDTLEIHYLQRPDFWSPNSYGKFDNYEETGPNLSPYDDGKYDQALVLDGSVENYIQLPDAALTGLQDFTYATWFNSYDIDHGTSGFTTLLSVYSGSATNGLMFLVKPTYMQVYLLGPAMASAPYTFIDNTWYHAAITRVGSILNYYVNGELIYTDNSVPTTVINSQCAIIGQEQDSLCGGFDSSQTFEGLIDETMILHDGLSSTDIKSIYDNKAYALRQHYTFDGTADSAVSSDHGTWTGNENYGDGISGSAAYFDGSSYIRVLNSADLQITSSVTVSMWLKADDLLLRRSVLEKVYGGEFAWTQETSGLISMYYGTSGVRAQPYQGTNTVTNVLGGSNWVFVTWQKDVDNSKLNVFVNGELVRQNTLSYPTSAASTYDLIIGDGYMNPYKGYIDDMRIYDIALSTTEIQNLYSSYVSPQSFSLNSNMAINTIDSPSYMIDTSIYEGISGGTKLSEYYVSIGASDYGVKLDNGVWKTLSGATINDIVHNTDDSYSVVFNVIEYTKIDLSTARKLEIYLNKGNESILVSTHDNIASGIMVAQVDSDSGYLIDASISASSNLGTALYGANSAEGAVTQGAFALKFSRQTELAWADVSQIVSKYDNYGHDNPFADLLEDYAKYLFCDDFGLDRTLGDPTCTDMTINWPIDTFGSSSTLNTFANRVKQYRNGLDLSASGVNWADQWFWDVARAGGISSSSIAGSLIDPYYDHSDSKYKFFYNKEATSYSINIDVDGVSGDEYKLYEVSSSGSTTDITSLSQITVDTSEYHYFYIQFAHETDTSKFRIEFTPVEKEYDYAFLEHVSGTGTDTVLQSYHTGLSGASMSKPRHEVSHVEFILDDNGSPLANPVFRPLSLDMTTEKYYVNRMVAMGGLPQVSEADPLGSPISAMTYAKPNGGGEKLISDTSYWGVGSDESEGLYALESTSVDYFSLTNGLNYMTSFAVSPRYLSDIISLEITVTADSQIALYYENEYSENIGDPSYSGALNSMKTYTFSLDPNSGINSYILKINAERSPITTGTPAHCSNPDYHTQENCELAALLEDPDPYWIPAVNPTYQNPLLYIKLSGSAQQGVYQSIDGVEEYKTQSLSATGYITNLVVGNKFTDGIDNDRTDASVPPAARASMQAAADENPTENRVFDVTLLLEKIMQDFTNLRDDVKDKVYDILEIDEGLFQSTKVADMVWGLLDKYGFGSVERIINFFSTEENQNRLANIILGDDDLQTELNYNSGSLSYLAVAKVGVLVFADYIHDQYIADGDWRESLWNGIMTLLGRSGDTLVDIVSDLWTMTANAITAVKAGITEFIEGVKAGAEYLLNSVKTAIYSSVTSIISNIFFGFSKILEAIIPNYSVTFDQNQDVIINTATNQFTLKFEYDSDGIYITVQNMRLSITNFFMDVSIENIETLSPIGSISEIPELTESLTSIFVWIVATWLGSYFIKTAMNMKGLPLPLKSAIVVSSIMIYYLISILSEKVLIDSIIDDPDRKEKNQEAMRIFHLSSFYSMVALIPNVMIKGTNKVGIKDTGLELTQKIAKTFLFTMTIDFIQSIFGRESKLSIIESTLIKLLASIHVSVLSEIITDPKDKGAKAETSFTEKILKFMKELGQKTIESFFKIIKYVTQAVSLLKGLKTLNFNSIIPSLTENIEKVMIWSILGLTHFVLAYK